MATMDIFRHILLTGPPGVGKTTLIRRVCDRLKEDGANKDFTLSGFYTEELRETKSGQRIGFEIVDIVTERRACLASSTQSAPGAPRVGKYAVLLDQFEPLAVECLSIKTDDAQARKNLVVVDEIGKMESFSRLFCEHVERLYDKRLSPNLVVLATVPVDKGNLPAIVRKVRNASANQLVTVTKENRDQLVAEVVSMVLAALKGSST